MLRLSLQCSITTLNSDINLGRAVFGEVLMLT
jgi:hypothetical protein